MNWRRMPMEAESPEEYGYERIRSNLAESSCRDRTLGDLGVDLRELVLLYGDHRGHPGLRGLLAAEATLDRDDVLLTTGAAMALFLVHLVLLDASSHLIVVRPNYSTNLETPFAIGGAVTHVDLRLEDGFFVDPAAIEAAVRANTRLISVTTPHNPTGTEMSAETLRAILAIGERHGIHVLVDETYREMAGLDVPIAASLSARAISVSSVSKTYGVPGIRQGWLLSADRALMTRLLAAKEQMILTGSVIDEALAFEVLGRRAAWLPEIRAKIADHREIVCAWMADEVRLEWVEPTGGVVAFPRIRAEHPVDPEVFYARLLDRGVFVGPGRWFDQSPRHFRIGWGWPTEIELRFGLSEISSALEA